MLVKCNFNEIMIFSSLLFLFWFIPIFFAIYYIVPAKFKNLILFIGSIVFYGWGEPKYLILIFISILVNYIAGVIMERVNQVTARKAIMILALLFDFGMLMVFKYTGFFVDNINHLTGMSISRPVIELPLGISFYTFQIASYIIDEYRGEIKAEHNILTLGTYLVMFPQLIAGPIVVYKQVSDELKSRKISLESVQSGIEVFVYGLASKVLIANQCGKLWDDVAQIGYDKISMPLAWLAMVAYSLQIFFDFNGYSLMAIGLGRMLGFNMPQNFNYPYISLSITEFWRRWHITLSSWFRDYIYIPLGGNRKGKIRTYVNLFIVWFLTGFWHGASWNFIIWGLYFFVILLLEKSIIGTFLEKHRIISRIYTLLLIGVSWMIFAITDFSSLSIFIKILFSLDFKSDIVYYLHNYAAVIMIGCLFSTPVIRNAYEKVRNKISDVILMAALLLLCVSYLADASYNPFLYFRF